MSGFAIENGIPVPGPGERTKWPWPQMAVGDSVLIPIADARKACSHVSQWGKKSGRKFVTRKYADGAVRVWRVA